MLGTRGASVPERTISIKDSEADSCSMFTPKKPSLANSYEYSGSDKASQIRTSLNCCMLSLLISLILLSLITYASILSIKYIIVSTEHYGETQNCLHSAIDFDGWNYLIECLSCAEGFVMEEGKICLPE